eukprot:GILK01009351.1.p1 GENE.GILK01009351.1~~GILK01009351.1.p1  ORF type:complete len:309 (-),score=1.66 GILK01009351.1:134-1036(-)
MADIDLLQTVAAATDDVSAPLQKLMVAVNCCLISFGFVSSASPVLPQNPESSVTYDYQHPHTDIRYKLKCTPLLDRLLVHFVAERIYSLELRASDFLQHGVFSRASIQKLQARLKRQLLYQVFPTFAPTADMEGLVGDIRLHILGYLNGTSLARCRVVNSVMKSHASSNELWKAVYAAELGLGNVSTREVHQQWMQLYAEEIVRRRRERDMRLRQMQIPPSYLQPALPFLHDPFRPRFGIGHDDLDPFGGMGPDGIGRLPRNPLGHAPSVPGHAHFGRTHGGGIRPMSGPPTGGFTGHFM